MKKTTTPVYFDPEYFENVPCNLCGAGETETTVLYEAVAEKIPRRKEELITRYSSSGDEIIFERVVRCNRCGLIYISPRPKTEIIMQSYSAAEDERYVSQEKGRQVTFKRCINIVKEYKRSGRLLDIGAAGGIFVKAAVDAGFEAVGVEPARWLCDFAKNRYGVTVYPTDLGGAGFDDSSFDVVTMWDCLEHVPDPMETLRQVRRVLKPGGVVFVAYPRIDDIFARVFGRRWWFLLSIHLFYFTPKTLKNYFKKNDFCVLSHRPQFQFLEYNYLVERLKAYSGFLAGLAGFPARFLGLGRIRVPYFASQYLLIGRNRKGGN
ncbi:MAG: class I SAM-dependent methyltransferase [Candidatus Omnitrophota bacterium]|jgi:2-polyprenyl-3-methyl-5-hydroxy-6-metoxy-1,4-benzoquinol methylase